MMKKISFERLRQKLNKRSKNKSIEEKEKQTNGLIESKEYEEDCDRNAIHLNCDSLQSQNNESLASMTTTPETTHKSIAFPAELLQSFRNKFKRNHNKEKVNSKQNVRKDLNRSKTDLVLKSEELVEKNHEIKSNEDKDSNRSNVLVEKHEKSEQIFETNPKLDLKTNESMTLASKPIIDNISDEVFEESVDDIKHNMNDKKLSLTQEIDNLVTHGWYWGPISRSEAENKLMDQMDGAFLVRDSSDDHYLFSLSFRSYGRTLHTRIEYMNGLFSFYSNISSEGHSSVIQLIEESMANSHKGVFCYSRGRSSVSPSFPVRLTRPVSRFTEVRSLQYLCKFVIRKTTNYSQIQSLPLPQSIKGFIENGCY